jgi:sulfide:quinone oxidoreductase
MSATGDRLDVLIAGGGVAALEAVIALRALAGERVAIRMLAPEDDFVYRPLSVAEPFGLGETRRYPLRRLADDFDVELLKGSLTSVVPSDSVAFSNGDLELAYDALVVAVGARRLAAFNDALTFRGDDDVATLRRVAEAAEAGSVGSVAFVVPSSIGWPLPLYELALMTARRARESGSEVRVVLVTPEEEPLAIFGREASQQVGALLEEVGIEVRYSAHAEVLAPGVVSLSPGGEELRCGRVVALPALAGPSVPGLPADPDGFIPTDNFGRVPRVAEGYAAGDGTTFPVKQGGIACQQADAVAGAIAKRAGVPGEPEPFRPVLRGMLLTGGDPRYMRTELSGRLGGEAKAGTERLWWPPSKIAGDHLAPYLSQIDAEALASGGAKPLELALDRLPPGVRRRALLASDEHGGGFSFLDPASGAPPERPRRPRA